MDAGFAPILFVLLVSMTAVQSQIRKRPANAFKKVGDSVTLECVTVNKNCDKVDWQKVEGLQSPKLVYRNGQGMLNNDFYPPQRYSVNSTGGCSLTITRMEINDSGRFICMQAVDSGDETRSSILIVISVAESCLSNLTSNSLDKGDGYSFWCAINIPAKSVEPSNVTLSFHNKIVGETETTDENQPQTVKTTLTGTAKKENITPRVCRASFLPNPEANYDNTTAILDICTTQQLIVSYPVSTPDPPKEGAAKDGGSSDGGDESDPVSTPDPPKEGAAKDGGSSDGGDESDPVENITGPVIGAVKYGGSFDGGDEGGCIAGIAICCCCCGIITISVVGGVVVWKVESCPGHDWFHSKIQEVCFGAVPIGNIFISVSRHGPGKGFTVGLRCAADGHPPPTFKWTHLKSGDVLHNDPLVIMGDVGDKYTCTATNTVNGKETSQNITIEYTSPRQEDRNGERANDQSTDFSFGEPKMTSTNFTFGEPEKGPEKPPRRNDAPEGV